MEEVVEEVNVTTCGGDEEVEIGEVEEVEDMDVPTCGGD